MNQDVGSQSLVPKLVVKNLGICPKPRQAGTCLTRGRSRGRSASYKDYSYNTVLHSGVPVKRVYLSTIPIQMKRYHFDAKSGCDRFPKAETTFNDFGSNSENMVKSRVH